MTQLTAIPDKHFAVGPYSARPSGGENAWWYVANATGYNCLQFPYKPGAKFTNKVLAEQLASAWNKQTTH